MDKFNKALKYSFILLKYRARAKKEIFTRLKQKGYTESCSKNVVKFLEGNNYLNDEIFVRLFTDAALEKNWGPLKIVCKLKRLGISENLCKRLGRQNGVFNEKIRDIIKEKWRHHKEQSKKISKTTIQQKIIQYLTYKGFMYDDIHRCLQEFFESGGEE